MWQLGQDVLNDDIRRLECDVCPREEKRRLELRIYRHGFLRG